MSFNEMNLIEPLHKALVKEGYAKPTPIQKQAVPIILEGKDLLGIAQTGTGKTAAFVLPILQLLSKNPKPRVSKCPRVLVIAPTRELAAQIDESFSAYGHFTDFRHEVIFGGVGQWTQVKSIAQGIDILTATPGRLLDLMTQGHVKLDLLEFFVLDEADRMLDMGFIVDIKKIVARLPAKRQSLFFSATMPHSVSALAASFLINPVRVEVAPQATTVELVKQKVFFVDRDKKDDLLLELLTEEHMTSVLIFAGTKKRADKVARLLTKNKIKAEAIHGDKTQSQRVNALQSFKNGKTWVLVATDIAARGIDIDNISHVVNFDLPNEPEGYVHRIGRTARAGAKGDAYSFCSANDRDFLRAIEKLTGVRLEVETHKLHSEFAKNATGAAARPPPRQQFHRGGKDRHEGGASRPSSHKHGPQRSGTPKRHAGFSKFGRR